MKPHQKKLAAPLLILAIAIAIFMLLKPTSSNTPDTNAFPIPVIISPSNPTQNTHENPTTPDPEATKTHPTPPQQASLETQIIQFKKAQARAHKHHFCYVAIICPEINAQHTEQMSRLQTYENCLNHTPGTDVHHDPTREYAAIQAGRLQFNPAQATECLKAIDQAATNCNRNTFLISDFEEYDMNKSPHTLAPCKNVFTPMQNKEDPCFNDNECSTGKCDGHTDDCELGQCTDPHEDSPPADIDESCMVATCKPGLRCVHSYNGNTGETKVTCEPPRISPHGQYCDYHTAVCAPGLSCYEEVCLPSPTFGTQNASCDRETKHCQIGLTCRETPDLTELKCLPHAKLGEPCTTHTNCIHGLWCQLNDTDFIGKCTKPLAIGTPCSNHDSCGSNAMCRKNACAPDSDSQPNDLDHCPPI